MNDRSIEGETTRVGAVRYLEGASGHGVLSTLFLLLAGSLFALGEWGPGVMTLVVAMGVSLNGLSIYAWDRLRAAFATDGGSDEEGSTRTLTPHSLSAEMKAELLAGLVMLGAFVAFLVAVTLALRAFSARSVATVLVVGLAVGNLGALAWTYGGSRG